MSTGWAGGSTRRWRLIRAGVLLRDGYLCQLRLDVCTQVADCVHHTRGKALGDDPRWLVASCTACNLKLGDPTKLADPPNEGVTRW